jgi:hypothetical protein
MIMVVHWTLGCDANDPQRAVMVREEWYGDTLGHVVMQDPEGDEFCIA